MSWRTSFAGAAALVSIWLVATPAVVSAATAGDHRAIVRAHGGQRPHAWISRHRFVRDRSLPRYGYDAPVGIAMPGYIYVPGRGILDEACNLPTSACPNSERDIQ